MLMVAIVGALSFLDVCLSITSLLYHTRRDLSIPNFAKNPANFSLDRQCGLWYNSDIVINHF